ncbi:integrase core domain-containing protein [Bradyrhizobium glycinis]|uniref:integrase core domain-containing protein n=1 Tax=Bradyrhizobium glycinis TaxID=2751812 RepID=UPI0035E11208
MALAQIRGHLSQEDIYLKGYSDGHEAKTGIARWMEFYNFQRPHQALENRAPRAVWCHRRIRRRGCGYDASRKREARTRCALPTSPQPQQQQAIVA